MKPVHYMIHVRNLEGAISFYEKALNLAVVDRHRYDGATLVYMRTPHTSFEVELVAPDEWPYADKPEFGRTHIAFTVDDLCQEHVRLAKLGVSVDQIMSYTANGAHQTRFFYFNDPEGNQIEFLEPHGRYASERN